MPFGTPVELCWATIFPEGLATLGDYGRKAATRRKAANQPRCGEGSHLAAKIGGPGGKGLAEERRHPQPITAAEED